MPAGLTQDLAGSRMLSATQVQELLKCGKSKLYGLIMRRANPVPSVKIGNSRRFPLDKLRWWIENLEQ